MRFYIAIAIDNVTRGADGAIAEAKPTLNAAHDWLKAQAVTIPKYEWDCLEIEQREIAKVDQAAFLEALNANLNDPGDRPGTLKRHWRMTQRGGLRELELPRAQARDGAANADRIDGYDRDNVGQSPDY